MTRCALIRALTSCCTASGCDEMILTDFASYLLFHDNLSLKKLYGNPEYE
jgi:hypothetical protein